MAVYKIAAVSYINTIPMLEGFKLSGLSQEIEVTLAAPSECARLFKEGHVDIALLPVAELPNLPNPNLITDSCIGCEGAVRTVVLVSNKELVDIRNVQLDADSRTSNMLIQVLAKEHFHLNWTFLDPEEIGNKNEKVDAVLAIGDKVFDLEKQYSNIIDLGEAWFDYTQLPFTFAVWVSKKELPPEFEARFSEALEIGIRNIPNMHFPNEEMRDYLENYISFSFDDKKKKALSVFMEKMAALNSSIQAVF